MQAFLRRDRGEHLPHQTLLDLTRGRAGIVPDSSNPSPGNESRGVQGAQKKCIQSVAQIRCMPEDRILVRKPLKQIAQNGHVSGQVEFRGATQGRLSRVFPRPAPGSGSAANHLGEGSGVATVIVMMGQAITIIILSRGRADNPVPRAPRGQAGEQSEIPGEETLTALGKVWILNLEMSRGAGPRPSHLRRNLHAPTSWSGGVQGRVAQAKEGGMIIVRQRKQDATKPGISSAHPNILGEVEMCGV